MALSAPHRTLAVDLATGGATATTEDGVGPLLALRRLGAAVAAGHRGAAAPVAFTTGPLVGRPAPGLARCAAIGLSPLSGGVGETRAEGPFGAALHAAGADTLVLTGRAPTPSYLLVTDGAARLCDAADLWGTDTATATDRLARRHGSRAGVAVIGRAGERGARYASILTAGAFPLPRLGFGAVLGERNLKAVVCLGSAPAPVADPAALAALAAAYRAAAPDNPLSVWQYASPGFGAWPGTLTDPGYCGVRNFADTTTLPVAGLHPDRLAPWETGHADCPDCPTRCVKLFAGAALHQEAVAALGPGLGIDDAATVLAANAACQRLGLDPVSAAGTLACLAEAGEAGATPADWPAFHFGDADRLPGLLATIAAGTGEFADALRGGARRLADRLGQPRLAMTVRDVELPPFDPRVQPGLGLAYAVSPVGPRYDLCEHDLDFDTDEGRPHCYPEARRLGLRVPEPAGRLDAARADRTAVLLRLWSALDALLICPYASTPTRPLGLDAILEVVTAVTGQPYTEADLYAAGDERWRSAEAVNTALGRPVVDRLPDRLHTEPVGAGRYAGAVLAPDAFTAAARRLRATLDPHHHTERSRT